MSVTDLLGDDCSTTEDNQVVNKKYSVKIPDGYIKSSMKILVYVQRPYDSKTAPEGKGYGGYYVDNCASGKLGEDLKLLVCGNMSGGGNEDIIQKEDIIF